MSKPDLPQPAAEITNPKAVFGDAAETASLETARRAAKYEFVKCCAFRGEPVPTTAVEIVEQAGSSLADFEEDLRRYSEAAELRDLLKPTDEIESQIESLTADLERAKDRAAKAAAKAKQRIQKLMGEKHSAEQGRRQREGLLKKLAACRPLAHEELWTVLEDAHRRWDQTRFALDRERSLRSGDPELRATEVERLEAEEEACRSAHEKALKKLRTECSGTPWEVLL